MSLRSRLEAFKEKFQRTAPPEIAATMHRATEQLERSGVLERVRKVGERAPEFELPNQDGVTLRSRELLAQGPLVVSFYRGFW